MYQTANEISGQSSRVFFTLLDVEMTQCLHAVLTVVAGYRAYQAKHFSIITDVKVTTAYLFGGYLIKFPPQACFILKICVLTLDIESISAFGPYFQQVFFFYLVFRLFKVFLSTYGHIYFIFNIFAVAVNFDSIIIIIFLNLLVRGVYSTVCFKFTERSAVKQ